MISISRTFLIPSPDKLATKGNLYPIKKIQGMNINKNTNTSNLFIANTKQELSLFFLGELVKRITSHAICLIFYFHRISNEISALEKHLESLNMKLRRCTNVLVTSEYPEISRVKVAFLKQQNTYSYFFLVVAALCNVWVIPWDLLSFSLRITNYLFLNCPFLCHQFILL